MAFCLVNIAIIINGLHQVAIGHNTTKSLYVFTTVCCDIELSFNSSAVKYQDCFMLRRESRSNTCAIYWINLAGPSSYLSNCDILTESIGNYDYKQLAAMWYFQKRTIQLHWHTYTCKWPLAARKICLFEPTCLLAVLVDSWLCHMLTYIQTCFRSGTRTSLLSIQFWEKVCKATLHNE